MAINVYPYPSGAAIGTAIGIDYSSLANTCDSTAGIYSGTLGYSTTYSPKVSKQKLTCCKCKTLIAEVYSFPIGDVTCKSCHQLEKLIE